MICLVEQARDFSAGFTSDPRRRTLMSTRTQQDVCCLMGDPVAGNPTQYMLEKAFAVADLDWRFLTFEVPTDDFETALKAVRIFDFRGVMLAPPHRGRVSNYLESATDAARLSHQVNCLVQHGGQLRGHNTEGLALRRLVERRGPLKGAKATILGSGRMARGIAAELAIAGVAAIDLVCIAPAQPEPLVAALRGDPQTASMECRILPWPAAGSVLTVPEDCRLLVNATPVGRHDPKVQLPVDVGRAPPGLVVADVVYNPPATRLVRDAQQRGLHVVDGLTLLVEQAALAFELWTGKHPDREAMREAVEEFLVL
jgi:shikimate dehydrogenase